MSKKPVPVDPEATFARIAAFVREAQERAAEFPTDSKDHIYLMGQAWGAYQAMASMAEDLGNAIRTAGEPRSVN